MLRRVPVGACEAQPVVGLRRARAPHLRAVEDVAVAVACEPRERARHVGSAARLGQQLDPLFVAAQDAREVALLQQLGAVVEQRRRRASRSTPCSPAGTRRPIRPRSSKNTFWCWRVSPAPPYSFGNAMPAKPASKSSCLELVVGERLVAALRGGCSIDPRACPLAERVEALHVGQSTSVIRSSSDFEERAQPLLVLFGRAVHRPVHGDAPRVQVDVVLPGDADAAVDLHAVVDDDRGSGRRRTPWPRSRGAAASSVLPVDRRARPRRLIAFENSSHTSMSAIRCLSAWNDAIGRPNA